MATRMPWSNEEVQTFLYLVAEERIQRELDRATRNKRHSYDDRILLVAVRSAMENGAKIKATQVELVLVKRLKHHLKKLEGRRLDFDYKKKRQGKIPDEEVRQALEKFHESKEVAEISMYNLLETDIEQVSQLSSLVESQLQYHRQAVQILDELSDKLRDRMKDAQSRPRKEYMPKPKPVIDFGDPSEQSNGGFTPSSAPPMRNTAAEQPCCKALYDFDPENEGELGFHEGDIINLTNQIDENWYEGMLRGQSGFFPLNYVEVIVPLPH
ncbi:endophilin-A2 [Pimephales promelas]|nr:endophilin-A2 [Pimephales promelas]